MNQKIKTIGVFAILPLFMIAIAPDFLEKAFAENVGSQDVIGRPGYQPGKVCGDRLCSDSAPTVSEGANQQESVSDNSNDFDALSAQHAKKTQELQVAKANGDSDKVTELQDELRELRKKIEEWKR